MDELLQFLKQNLILEHDEDDALLRMYIAAAISYAEKYQHRPDGFYQTEPISVTSKQAVIILATHFYESRDGSSSGFFLDSTSAAQQTWDTVNTLLRLDRDWKV